MLYLRRLPIYDPAADIRRSTVNLLYAFSVHAQALNWNS